MRIDNSLQRRVFATFGAFTLLLCLVYTAICALVAYIIEDQVLDNLLADEAAYIEGQYLASGEVPRPRLPYIQLYSASNPAPAEIRTALPEGANRAEWFGDAERHFHLRRLSLDENTSPILAAEVGRLLTVSRQSRGLLWLIFTALLVTLALALWVAYRISSRTIRPVIALAEEVRSRQKDGAPLSLAATSAKDEIGFLARTLETTLNQLKLALRRESEFTRDASHELRTAITIAKNTLALSLRRELSQGEKEDLHSTVEQMECTVSALLALARAESIAREPVEIRSLLEERILAQHHRIAEMQFRARLELPRKYHSLGNRNLAALLIDNLLNNAIRHASQPELRIYAEKGALVFENPIAENFDTDRFLLPGGKSDKSDGLGQGLFLVKRILAALDWEFSVDCANGLFRCTITPTHFPT
ncbi:HAMP domain-containing sensor histidine kinase [Microbulbifer magnicolonia]|uniref:sensor histidine kinase n=1 Tax=Microbulbifer magnicolonia TaxID=3109744 RepID=UPI002B40F0E5|nr:HAMP domain-containing sensor histidine kinase [Microbulbifer sp. GG15]